MKNLIAGLCLYVVVILPGWACSYWTPRGTYEIREGQVYYQHSRDSEAMLVEGVDIATFLSNTKYSDAKNGLEKGWFLTDYASDVNHVYYRGQVLEGIDPSKAVFLRQDFSLVSLIEGLERYRAYDGRKDGYLKDDEEVYYRGELIEGANGGNFGWLPEYNAQGNGWDYVRDDQHIYLYGQQVAGDPKTAAEIFHGYYLDADHIYFRGDVLEGALPDSFELPYIASYGGSSYSSVFIVSNGHVFYRNERLPLDGDSFKVLTEVAGDAYVACGAGVFAGSLVMDKNGVYYLHSSGDLELISEVDGSTFELIPRERFRNNGGGMQFASDHNQLYYYWIYERKNFPILTALGLKPLQAYQEVLFLDGKTVDTYYKDGHAIYRDLNIFSTGEAQNIGDVLGIDVETFEVYATLWNAIIFRDKNMYYLRQVTSGSTQFIPLVNSDAKLMCLEKDHLCLLDAETLYFVFDDGTMKQIQVNVQELHCARGGYLYSGPLAAYSENGVCFDDAYYFSNGESCAFSTMSSHYLAQHEKWYKPHDFSMQYAMTEDELEAMRLRSLERVSTQRKPFLLE